MHALALSHTRHWPARSPMRSRPRARRRYAHGALGGRCLVCGGLTRIATHAGVRSASCMDCESVLEAPLPTRLRLVAHAGSVGGMTRALGVIGVPSSAGAYAPGQEQAPRALREAGLLAGLEAAGIAVVDHGDAPVWRWRPDREQPYAQNPAAVVACAAETAERVRIALAAGELALVLGGDCTVGVGTVAGHLPESGRVGLVYLDMHGDLNTPDSVPDGALDWMGVAHMLGEPGATPELRDFGPRTPLLDDDQIVLLAHDRGTARRASCERDRAPRPGRRPAWRAVAADPAARRARGARVARRAAIAWSCTSTSTASTSPMRRCPRTRAATSA